jgi:hypothetical protein
MYPTILTIHNIFRWVVLILAVVALFNAYRGWLGRRDWNPADRKIGTFFAISLDIQVILGLLLYVIGPWLTLVVENFSAAMQNDELRFFSLEHIFYMTLAVIFVHIGSVLSRSAPEAVAKHRRAAIWFTLTTLIIIIAIPWWRPLLPGLG